MFADWRHLLSPTPQAPGRVSTRQPPAREFSGCSGQQREGRGEVPGTWFSPDRADRNRRGVQCHLGVTGSHKLPTRWSCSTFGA